MTQQQWGKEEKKGKGKEKKDLLKKKKQGERTI